MTAPPEMKALEAALLALENPPDATHLPNLSRAVTRAADDLELVAEETADRAVRKDLLIEVAKARNTVTAARKRAKQAALTADRTQLLEDAQDVPKKETESDAAQLAREINDSLRRTTAIVSEEIDRSRAAGDVVEESTRRLRMTRNQHGRYGESLSSGAVTLKSIRRTEVIANVLLIASVAIFFLAAARSTNRRLANSNISTFVIRPGMKMASMPHRIVGWMVRALGRSERKTGSAKERKVPSSAQLADEALKATEGRERTVLQTNGNTRENAEDTALTGNGKKSEEESETCRTEEECKAPNVSDTKEGKDLTTDGAAEKDASVNDDSGKRASKEPENVYAKTTVDRKDDRTSPDDGKVEPECASADCINADDDAGGYSAQNGPIEPSIPTEDASGANASTLKTKVHDNVGYKAEEELTGDQAKDTEASDTHEAESGESAQQAEDYGKSSEGEQSFDYRPESGPNKEDSLEKSDDASADSH